jgi:hypothetical protein
VNAPPRGGITASGAASLPRSHAGRGQHGARQAGKGAGRGPGRTLLWGIRFRVAADSDQQPGADGVRDGDWGGGHEVWVSGCGGWVAESEGSWLASCSRVS